MKKIIVLACAVALACASFGSIVSSDVVGYTTKPIDQGWSMQTPMFESVGLEGMSIQDIKPVGDDVAGGGLIYFYVYDTARKPKYTFAWNTIEDDDEDADGWYNSVTAEFADYTFEPGDAFILYAPYELSFSIAGKVKKDATPFVMASKGWYIVGNPTPVAVDLQDLVPTGDNVAGGGLIYFYVYDTARKPKYTFAWNTIEDDDEEADGWYNSVTGAFADYSIEPGDSVIFYAPYPLTITFPAALAD